MVLKESKFCCPICKNKMFITENSVRCMLGHSFDIAKEGYINLLIKNAEGKRHGDDKLMVKAREHFLSNGYYSRLKNAVSEVLGSNNVVLDSGCGEGYYTSLFAEKNEVIGIDISKEAVKSASKKCKNASFAVASIGEIPIADQTVDKIVNIFAPDSNNEFLRILKPGGVLITVTPMENHLYELKKAVYENPYLNPAPITEKQGFKALSKTELKYDITLNNNEDILSLFKMTPYYYKTSKSDQDKLNSINLLNTKLEFLISEYRKI